MTASLFVCELCVCRATPKVSLLSTNSSSGVCAIVLSLLLAAPLLGQGIDSSRPDGAPSTVNRGIELATKGQCREALPLLKKYTHGITDRQLKYRALMATVRCALNQKDEQAAASTLFDFKREFPEDPEVLYMTSEFFLEIAERASQELGLVAPNSYQALELQAETLESQNKWEEAAAIYKQILKEHPKLRGIHFRLGRMALSQPESRGITEDVKKEFEQELAIDPVNAAAEFWLGEIGRRDAQWDDAISHFTSAVKIDSNYAEAFLALGMTLNSAERFSEAIPQLQKYIRMSPDDPAGHYQLSISYNRTGRKEEFEQETTLVRELNEKRQAAANARVNVAPH